MREPKLNYRERVRYILDWIMLDWEDDYITVGYDVGFVLCAIILAVFLRPALHHSIPYTSYELAYIKHYEEASCK